MFSSQPRLSRILIGLFAFITASIYLRQVIVRSNDPVALQPAAPEKSNPRPAAPPASTPAETAAGPRISNTPHAPRAPSPLVKDSSAARILAQPHDLSDPVAREELVEALRAAGEAEFRAAQRKAKTEGHPLVTEKGAVLVGFEGDRPLYDQSHNQDAGISTATDQVRGTAPYSVTGEGLVIGMWEAGQVPRATHDQLVGRVTIGDGESNIGAHATHVAGTLAAAGTPGYEHLRGMAPAAHLVAFNSVQEIAEMAAYAAALPNEPGKVYVSNHAYGIPSGWTQPPMTWYGTFSDDGNPNNDYPDWFGRYGDTPASWDGLVHAAPYYLPFKSAGNERNDFTPFDGAEWRLNSPTGTVLNYDPATHPKADYNYRTSNGKTGFDTIALRGVAKNIVTVGSVSDAVSNGLRDPSMAQLSDSSSAGPTDDGRIKPDIVANGESLLSLGAGSDSDQSFLSGSSMATANASGSALLLQELYRSFFPGDALRGSSLKALILGTSDDLGNPGPDYQYGWGLMNLQTAADHLIQHASSPYLRRIHEGNLSDGSNDEFDFLWDGVSPIHITLTWMDPAGAPTLVHDNRAPRLVHDLNLKIIAPDGTTTYLPYTMPWVGDWTDATLDAHAVPGINTVDTVEQVYLESPTQAGTYTVSVSSVGTLTEDQPYSLILRGGALPTSGYGQWAINRFPSHWDDPTVTGFHQDPDGNGIPNGMEYAFNLPSGSSAPPDPQIYSTSEETESGIDYFTLTYQRDTSKDDLHYTAQWSSNLVDWTPLTSTLQSTSGPIDTLKASVPMEGDKKFIRLFLSLQ